MCKSFGLAFGLFVSLSASAMVDTSTGAFTHSWIDYQGKGLDLKIKLERTYNSRSNHKGWFGFGWCSDLETAIHVDESSISAVHCGDGQENVYKKMGSIYKGQYSGSGVFKKVGANFVRSFSDGTEETFNSSGKLIEIKKHQDFISIRYNDKGTPKELSDGGGRVIKISTSPDGYISEIVFNGKKPDGSPIKETVATYSYKGEDLISVKNAWGNIYGYEYDKDHNLIKATWPNKNTVEIGYNNNDWVRSVSGTSICSESYDYKVDTTKNPAKYAVSVQKKCPKGEIVERAYSYSYSLDNRRIVAAELDENGIKRNFKYDENGNVIEVIEHRPSKSGKINEIATKILRNDRGQIVKISNVFESRSYKYKQGSSRDLVVDVVYETVALGKVADSLKYSYSYDDEDRMISAVQPDGARIVFKYDEGILSKIASKDITIEIVYVNGTSEVKGINLGEKFLPLEIYDKPSTEKERMAVELYFDFVRAQSLIIPYY